MLSPDPRLFPEQTAPVVLYPRPTPTPYGEPNALFPGPIAADGRAASTRALVQLDDGSWVIARVPPAPPVFLPAPPQAAARQPLSRTERAAMQVVGSTCALTLSIGGALAMAGPYLADLAELAFGIAAALGAGAGALLVLRIAGALGLRSPNATGADVATHTPSGPVVNNNVTVLNQGLFSRGNATGIGRVDRIG
ncbi:hypothetical protein [Streptacidiphilus anmyonensis]|uniref:hypothetical protein n=1 Tax=Streptacidiphilus anmyonensis TaxID=405782 RepID=UPI0005A85E80|nr:hypothetical protein [Streptacidiphilus anmyonensis]